MTSSPTTATKTQELGSRTNNNTRDYSPIKKNDYSGYRGGDISSPPQSPYEKALAQALFDTNKESSQTYEQKLRKLHLQNEKNDASSSSSFKSGDNLSRRRQQLKSKRRPITPTKTLEIPNIVEDFYTNLLDWSKKGMIAIALNCQVFLYKEKTGESTLLVEYPENRIVSCLNWHEEGQYLAVGTYDGVVDIFDTSALQKVRRMDYFRTKIGSLAWNKGLLSVGCLDGTIMHFNMRVFANRNQSNDFLSHVAEVCTLKWSPDGLRLASGGNDNMVYIWDLRGGSGGGESGKNHDGDDDNSSMNTNPYSKIDKHISAVKALAWCPWESNVLASGGGSADKTIQLWDLKKSDPTRLDWVQTDSQVCTLLWSQNHKELVSSHGFSENQIIIWDCSQMRPSSPSPNQSVLSLQSSKLLEFTAHERRVLHTVLSPDGNTLCSAAGDEVLKFWTLFEKESFVTKRSYNGVGKKPESSFSYYANLR